VNANVTGPLTNSVTLTSSTPLTNTADDTDTVVTPVRPSADLSLDMTSTPTAEAGQSGVVTFSVANSGPSLAQNVVLTATFPAGVTPPTGWTQVGSTNVYTYFVGDVPPGATVVVTGVVTFSSTIQPGTSIEFGGQVGATTPDPDPLDNVDNADTSILASGDLTISKSQVSANPVTAGSLVTYSIRITNSGPATVYNVDVKDQLPPGLSLQRVAASNGGVCAGTLCQFDDLPVGASRTMTVVARVDSGLPAGSVVNTAAVFGDNAASDSVTVTTFITTSADLSIAKADLLDPVIAGEVILYQLVITNAGPSAAVNVVVTDTIPLSTSFVGASPECSFGAGIVTCTLATLPPATSASFFVQVRVSDAILQPTTLTNTAAVRSSTPDPNAANNRDTVTTTAQQSPLNPTDLRIAKHGDPNPVTAGELLTYTLVVTNAGPAPATNVQVVDALPNGVSFVSAVASQGLCNGGVSCELGSLPVNATATITVVVQGERRHCRLAPFSPTWRASPRPTRTPTRPTTRTAQPPPSPRWPTWQSARAQRPARPRPARTSSTPSSSPTADRPTLRMWSSPTRCRPASPCSQPPPARAVAQVQAAIWARSQPVVRPPS
jgi:uncharacterized repeat protein (TIGR01451 family)